MKFIDRLNLSLHENRGPGLPPPYKPIYDWVISRIDVSGMSEDDIVKLVDAIRFKIARYGTLNWRNAIERASHEVRNISDEVLNRRAERERREAAYAAAVANKPALRSMVYSGLDGEPALDSPFLYEPAVKSGATKWLALSEDYISPPRRSRSDPPRGSRQAIKINSRLAEFLMSQRCRFVKNGVRCDNNITHIKAIWADDLGYYAYYACYQHGAMKYNHFSENDYWPVACEFEKSEEPTYLDRRYTHTRHDTGRRQALDAINRTLPASHDQFLKWDKRRREVESTVNYMHSCLRQGLRSCTKDDLRRAEEELKKIESEKPKGA